MLPTKEGGHVFGADPVGLCIGIDLGIDMTLSCMQDIS